MVNMYNTCGRNSKGDSQYMDCGRVLPPEAFVKSHNKNCRCLECGRLVSIYRYVIREENKNNVGRSGANTTYKSTCTAITRDVQARYHAAKNGGPPLSREELIELMLEAASRHNHMVSNMRLFGWEELPKEKLSKEKFDGPTWVYLLYGCLVGLVCAANIRLLYVGIANDIWKRLAQHERTDYGKAGRDEIKWVVGRKLCDSRLLAKKLEGELIDRLDPPYNKEGKRDERLSGDLILTL